MTLPAPRPAALLLALTCAFAAPRSTCGAIPHPFDAVALGVGPEAEVATFDVAVEGDPRPLEVVSVLWAPPAEDDAPPFIRWQFYSESFEHTSKAYHVRISSFFDLDPRSLVPRRRTQSFLTWEGGACCSELERSAEGPLRMAGGSDRTFDVGPRKILIGQMPLLVRAARFPESGRIELDVLRRDGTTAQAEIILEGRQRWPVRNDPKGPAPTNQTTDRTPDESHDETIEAERITVRYEGWDPNLLLEGLMVATGAQEETYWREAGDNHQLLEIDTARYGTPMTVRLRGETRRTLAALVARETATRSVEPEPLAAGRLDRLREMAAGDRPTLDEDFLSLPRWDDGQAEMAYYALDGKGSEGSDRLTLSILVKHRIDPSSGRKLDGDDPKGADAFFSLALYSLADPDAPVPVRRFFSAQALQQGLTPVTASVAQVEIGDQCGASLWFSPEAPVSDRRTCHVRRPPPVLDRPVDPAAQGIHLVQQMPLVIRALDLGASSGASSGIDPEAGRLVGEIPVRLPDGRVTTATVRSTGRETLTTPAGERTCERFDVRYERPPDTPGADLLPGSLLGPLPETETYWRDTGEHRQIVRMQADGRTLTLIEELRAPHWSEDFYPRLERVTGRP